MPDKALVNDEARAALWTRESGDLESQRRYMEITRYMRELIRFPPLPQKKFNALHRAWRRGDAAAFDVMVYSNARLVLSIALRHAGRGLALFDLLQEGMIGLMKAVRRFNPERGFKFSTYGTWWIRHDIQRAIADFGEKHPYHIPVHIQETIRIVVRGLEYFFDERGYWPDAAELHERLASSAWRRAHKLRKTEITRQSIHEAFRLLAVGYQSLDAPIASLLPEADSLMFYGDKVADTRIDMDRILDARRLVPSYRLALERIEAAVDRLPMREAMVLRLRFGLGEFKPMHLREIGERYGLSRERIRQLEAQGLRLLEEEIGVGGAQIEQIKIAIEEMARIVGFEPRDEEIVKTDGAMRSRRKIAPLPVFRLLCEHVIGTATGLRIVKAPVRILDVRSELSRHEALAVLQELVRRRLIRGRPPFEVIEIVPKVAIPEYRGGDADEKEELAPPVQKRRRA